MNSSNTRDTAGVVAPPPFIFLTAVGAGYLLSKLWPVSLPCHGVTGPAGVAAVLAGIAVMIWGLASLRRARTSVNPYQPTTALVLTGPYRYSRNPLYLALAFIHAGIGLWSGNPWIVFTVPPALVVIRYGVIAREERYLERKFGDAYRGYRARVRRWL